MKKKFSLIELLITIAIIAILAGMFLPALSKARERVIMTSCNSNLRQIGVMWHNYFSDYDDFLPATNGTSPYLRWQDYLYVMNTPGAKLEQRAYLQSG